MAQSNHQTGLTAQPRPRYAVWRGILNAFNSYAQLAAGEHSYIASTSNAPDGAPPELGVDKRITAFRLGFRRNHKPDSHRGFVGAREPLLFQRRDRQNSDVHGDACVESASGTKQCRQPGSVLIQCTTSNQVAVSVSTVDNRGSTSTFQNFRPAVTICRC